MYNTIFFIIIGILFFSYLLSEYLDFLNSKFRNRNIPKELEGIYDDEKYKKSQNYGKANDRFSFIKTIVQINSNILKIKTKRMIIIVTVY